MLSCVAGCQLALLELANSATAPSHSEEDVLSAPPGGGQYEFATIMAFRDGLTTSGARVVTPFLGASTAGTSPHSDDSNVVRREYSARTHVVEARVPPLDPQEVRSAQGP